MRRAVSPEETSVARRHFALNRKPSGSWTIELFGEPFVAINGTPADNGEVVRDGAKIELGKIGGPALTLAITEDARTDNYLRTVAQEAAPSARQVATQASTMARLARAVAAAAVVLVAGVGGFAAYSHYAAQRTAERLECRAKRIRRCARARSRNAHRPRCPQPVARSVFNVQRMDENGRIDVGGGTASVVGPSVLATNGHVAVMIQTLRPGERMIVRAPGENGAIYQVTHVTIHPGYTALRAFVSSDIRIRSGFRGLDSEFFRGNGYDVALLHVKETLPADLRLDIATAEEMNNLNPGTPLVTAGYPVELLQNTWALAKAATPELHVGTVTSVTDMFGLPSPAAHRQLVHFNWRRPADRVEVQSWGQVAVSLRLLNSGNVTPLGESGRAPNAALINFGQRADLVRDLLDGTAQKKLPDAQTYWQEVAKNFFQARGMFAQELIDATREELQLDKTVKPRMLAEIKATLNAARAESSASKAWTRQAASHTTLTLFQLLPVEAEAPAGLRLPVRCDGEGGETRLSLEIDGKVATTNLQSNYPRISCRLLTPAQQNTGNPKEPRSACASGHHRSEGMLIPETDNRERDVDVVIWNNKGSSDTLLNTDLTYTLQIYQWPKAAGRSAGLPR